MHQNLQKVVGMWCIGWEHEQLGCAKTLADCAESNCEVQVHSVKWNWVSSHTLYRLPSPKTISSCPESKIYFALISIAFDLYCISDSLMDNHSVREWMQERSNKTPDRSDPWWWNLSTFDQADNFANITNDTWVTIENGRILGTSK